MFLGFVEGVSLTDAILLIGLAGIFLKTIGEGRGWFRTASNLREENNDLTRRNHELEEAVARHETALARADEQIKGLEASVRDLEKLSQGAVLQALKDHEAGAEVRAQSIRELQRETNKSLLDILAAIQSTANERV